MFQLDNLVFSATRDHWATAMRRSVSTLK